ncbi:hypothetical protein LTR70_005639 [Exophiala xenobiotica]|uniref:Uncharacterized protein n=1 Tax=Lithohypha guttulata TaxID=1690604 RepID=A0ABR0JYS6_9EURO|nr:hypothetical protein LTR24_008842 [Lithohypha guttulata]KAK5317959.1 hypothetical protein LTR70_005639 [Exophiala xenobiotica]
MMLRPTAILRTAGIDGGNAGRSKLTVFKPQPTYQTYVSPYGPKTKHVPNFMGLSPQRAWNIGTIAAGFGVSAGIFALFFFGEVPKVRNDILSKAPLFGDYFVREIPPEDNPF